MPNASCPVCGCEVPTPRHTYCSRRCKWTVANRKQSTADPNRLCRGCGVSIGHLAGHAIYCSHACLSWIKNGNTEIRKLPTTCAQCGRPMEGKRAGAIYCTKACKNRACDLRRGRDDAARYLKERERRIAYATAYAKANPQVGQRAKRRRKAQIAGAGTFRVSARDWRRLCLRYGDRCAYCRKRGALTMDHILPISRGGRHSIGNLIPACASCNASKNDRTIMEWRLGRRLSRLKGGGSHPLEAQRTWRSADSRIPLPRLDDGVPGAA